LPVGGRGEIIAESYDSAIMFHNQVDQRSHEQRTLRGPLALFHPPFALT